MITVAGKVLNSLPAAVLLSVQGGRSVSRQIGGTLAAPQDHSRFRDELASGREASKQQRHFSLSASGLSLHASMSMRS